MSLYRKKPVVIEAVQWFKMGDHPNVEPLNPSKGADGTSGWIETLEGGYIVTPGDWIITGIKGEHYPCKPDIFAMTYEPASTPATSDKEARVKELDGHALLRRLIDWHDHNEAMSDAIEMGDQVKVHRAFSNLFEAILENRFKAEDARRALEAELHDDVVRLVIAARNVAYADLADPENLKELDDAAEAFSERVPYEDEPDDEEAGLALPIAPTEGEGSPGRCFSCGAWAGDCQCNGELP